MSAQLNKQLSRALRFSPHLRSLNIIDANGTVAASSSPNNIGKHPNIAGFEPSIEPAPGNLRIGFPWTGRDLGDGKPLLAGTEPIPNSSSFIIVSLQTPKHFTVAAALNSDYFINQIQLALNPDEGKTELLRYDGRLLLTTESDEQDELGKVHIEQALAKQRETTDFGTNESASYAGRAVLSAYRNSPQFPLTVIVHADRQFALGKWRNDALQTLMLLVPMMLLLAATGLWLHFELRRRDAIRRAIHTQEQQRLVTVLDSLPASILMLDQQGRIALANAAWNKNMDEACPELPPDRLGMHYAELLRLLALHGWHEQTPLASGIAALLNNQVEQLDQEIMLQHSSGTHWFRLLGRRLASSEATGALLMRIDITQQKKDTEQLRLASRIFESTSEGLLITDADIKIIWVNRAFEKITGYREEDVLGRDPGLLNSGLQTSTFYSQMYASLAATGNWQGEIINRRKDGTVYPEWLTISTLVDAGNQATHYVAIFSDITERKASEERIRYLSEHDFLTRLPNRMLFEDRLRQTIKQRQRQPQQFAILFIDLDHFKDINDNFGHPIGDRLLQAVAERLENTVRDSDTVCRQGGDEFLILLRDLNDAGDAARIADKIVHNLGQSYTIEGHLLHTSPSIGISLYPDDGITAEALIRNADTAMYVSKDEGRNTYHFFRPEMNERTLSRLSIEDGLRRALDNNEFELYYQPQVAIGSGDIIGVEALLRWNDPGIGMRMPTSFIPIAEESGLIIAIGDWVLQQACRQARLWHESGRHRLPISINIAAAQLVTPDFGKTVSNALAAEGLGPEAIELEISESILFDNNEEHLAGIAKLRELGLKLAIDDFGTGDSSLPYLHKLPIDKLKIERCFIGQFAAHADNAKIADAIISLAHSLGLNVLAEGVETADQLAFLKALGCDSYQGFVFSRPIPAMQLEKLLDDMQGHRQGKETPA